MFGIAFLLCFFIFKNRDRYNKNMFPDLNSVFEILRFSETKSSDSQKFSR